jgi:hypothetical protein
MSWGARRPFIQGKDLQNLKLTDEDKQFYFEFKSKTEGLEHQGRSAMFSLKINNGIPGPKVTTVAETIGIIAGSVLGVTFIILLACYCIRARLRSRTWDLD